MRSVDETVAMALQHHRAGRLPEAEALYRQALAADPSHADAWLLLGLVASQAGNTQAAIRLFLRAAALKPDFPEAYYNLGLVLHQQGRIEDAIAAYSRAVNLKPDLAEAYNNLGTAFRDQMKVDEAIACYERALALKPDYAEAHNNLGNACKQQGRLADAVGYYRQALSLRPDLALVHHNLASALKALGKLDEAIVCYRRVLTLKPDDPAAHRHLANALHERGMLDEAVASFGRAIELQAGDIEAHNNLGNVFRDLGTLDEAVASYQRALECNPHSPEAYNNLGNALKDQGRVGEALTCFQRAVELKPDFVAADSNLLYTLLFSPDHDAAAVYAEHCRWNQQHAAPLASLIRPHPNDRTACRRLRVGYVSPDFYNHCQSFFTVPLFSLHDQQSLELFCYSDVARPDGVTKRLRSNVEGWRDIVGASDEVVAEQIRDDRIDILVDLSMHMAYGRPLLMARKPAPVQVCWFAYPGTTGMTAIDYRLTDPYLDPPSQDDRFYSEKSIRLPDTFWCYDPLASEPKVNSLPALESGCVTFGSLNNFCKTNAPLLKLWARVLRAVDHSRLILLAAEGSHRRRVIDLLAQEEIAANRVQFVERQPRPAYLALYHQIDIGLDTLPYNGHVTSLDALWMGVPVVTLVGQTVVGRAGLSQLTNLGLPELIAHTPDDYVQIAAGLAVDLARLSKLRGSLRERMQTSPLMDTPRFARGMEAAYRMMWQQWCSVPGGAAA